MNEKNQKDLQERYLEFNLISQKMKQIEKSVEAISGQMMEVAATHQGLEEVSKVAVGTEILVPLSNGIFAKAELKDNKELLINVGSDAVVKKSIPDTINFVLRQMENLRNLHQQYVLELQNLAAKAAEIEKEMAAIAG